jgi:YYY domain-containing protein
MDLAGAVLVWALLVWLSSALGFLCLRPLFASWADQGYALARTVGPLVVGSAAWLLAGVGALPLSVSTAIAALGIIALAAATTWRHQHLPQPAWRRLLLIDAAWIASVCAFGLIRSWSPSIVGAERPMDHALLAALLHQQAVPPADPWLAGFPVNYHYVGHALWAPFGLLSGQSPWVVYNLVLITLPGQVLVAAWSLGHRLHAAWAWAGAAALVVSGPLAPVAHAIRTGQLPGPQASTRVIPDTVNEFPFFSLTWGDLHGHVIALPLLAGLAVALVRLDELTHEGARATHLAAATAVVALLGTASVLTSSWDVAPVALAALLTARVLARTQRPAATLALAAGATLAAAMCFPVVATFRPPSVPIGWEWQGSPIGPFLLVQGTWLLPATLGCLTRGRLAWLVSTAAALAVVAWLAPGMAVRAGLAALAAGTWQHRAEFGRVTTALVLSGLASLILAECVWVDDVYGWQYRRLNTVFKLHLHAIVLLTLALPGLLHVLWSTRRAAPRTLVRGACVALALIATLAPLMSLASYYRDRELSRTLNGLAGTLRHHPGDAEAIAYLWRYATADDVVLEAAGQSYSYASRISTMTGVPTLLGWKEHEHLWRRGASWQGVIDGRARTVDALYAGPPHRLRERLREAGITYVVVGRVERRRYAGLDARRFADVATAVVDTEGMVLLRVR